MLEEILAHLHNWFEVPHAKISGEFTVQDGSLELPSVLPGQYIRIEGSVFNDGLHQCPVSGLTDETFTGCVYPLAVPKAVQEIAEEIQAWIAKHPASDKVSESFGGYTYSRGTSATTGNAATWQDVFRPRLNRWRCL